MRLKFRSALLVFSSVFLISQNVAAQAVKGSCRPDDDMSARVVEFFGSLVTPFSPVEVKLRDDLGLAGVTASQVVRVDDAPLCAKAARAMDTLAETKQQEYSLYVVRVGDSFGVVDMTWKSGEYVPAILFDRHWKLRRILLAF